LPVEALGQGQEPKASCDGAAALMQERSPLLLKLRAMLRDLVPKLGAIWRATRRRFQQPPHPWGTLLVGFIGLVFAAISATFAGLNYFKVPKARAAIMLDRFDPMQGEMDVPGLGKRISHNLRLWVANTGQASAILRSVTISTEFYDAPLEAAAESQRMDYVAKNKATIGSSFTGLELTSGQKMYFTSHAGFTDPLWSDFSLRKRHLYQFALVTFTDEMSGEHEITREICVRVDPDLTWVNCTSGHNQTIR
jgi:hypothetical protein